MMGAKQRPMALMCLSIALLFANALTVDTPLSLIVMISTYVMTGMFFLQANIRLMACFIAFITVYAVYQLATAHATTPITLFITFISFAVAMFKTDTRCEPEKQRQHRATAPASSE